MFPNLKVVEVITGPVRVDGQISRAVKLSDGSGRVETWSNGAWAPGGARFDELLLAPPASPETLAKFGVTG